MKKVIKCAAEDLFAYATDFQLTVPVNDYEAAHSYLQKEDMTPYLKRYLKRNGISEDIISNILNIMWILDDEISGYIRLKATQELDPTTLDLISDWVSGQNSDGLGEGFEQQDFAWTPYDEDEDEGGWDADGEMSSFDWETNDYRFELVYRG